MAMNLTQKLIAAHLVEGEMIQGQDIALRIDQTLTQDATGTMAYLALEAMDIPRVRTEYSIAYIDHNTLQCGFENPDDHQFIQSVCRKFGVRYSRPGNGICHQVHLERFGKPGKTLIGSDSHTPTGGALGMLAMGAGGMDVAVAMGGGAYHIPMPKVFNIRVKGQLNPWASAKDVALYLLRILSVKGGVGAVMEWSGEGIKNLTVPQRATITNMGAELGATTSVFPSDDVTKAFLAAQGREEDWQALAADEDAEYDRVIDIDLADVKPLLACPHSPDNVKEAAALSDIPVTQVCIGSCTNSSLADMLRVAAILKGKKIKDTVSLSISPGSRQVLTMLSRCGALEDMIAAGARILECACGPCIGMGFSPSSGGVSVRTFNRNFEGRSGTRDAQVYLASPEVAAASALTGFITDPSTLGEAPVVEMPDVFAADDSGVIQPADMEEAKNLIVQRGPNIKPFPKGEPLPDTLAAKLTLKVGDNITTDHIMPAGAKILPFRSNVPKLSEFCFTVCDEQFPARALENKRSFIIGGMNYGQGSSREHAALAPLHLGVRAVITKSFARIHVANLINAGILPLTFKNPEDYDLLNQDEDLVIENIYAGLESGEMTLRSLTTGKCIPLVCSLTRRQGDMLKAGGLLQYTKEMAE